MRCRVTLYSCFHSSSLGRERPFSGARVTSAFPPIATKLRTFRVGSFGPITAIKLLGWPGEALMRIVSPGRGMPALSNITIALRHSHRSREAFPPAPDPRCAS